MSDQDFSYDILKHELNKRESALITFETEEELSDNTATMNEFLELFNIPDSDILQLDGTYAVLFINYKNYEVHASGNGCFRTHKIEISLLD